MNGKQVCALQNLEGSFLDPDATCLLSRANDFSTQNTKNAFQSPNTSEDSGTTESQSSHFPKNRREDDNATSAVTSADIAIFLLYICYTE